MMDSNKTVINMEDTAKNKRDEILIQAANLFRKKGFSGTSMQDIARDVGILKGSIYYYFNSKNEIFREVLNKGISPVLKNAEFIMAKDLSPAEKLRELLRSHIDYIMHDNYSLILYFQEKEKISVQEIKKYLESRNKYEKIFKDLLAQGIKQGVFPKVDITLTVYAILGMCNWIVQWYNPKGSRSPKDIVEHMVYLICDLMLNPSK
ncbi:MAG: TetR/AcrR family transcriptional regulator [Epulopiscium sp.]|nr:TetR/AcrR family transcriptional regulator [Candidatus Epulonipiscium sp.]